MDRALTHLTPLLPSGGHRATSADSASERTAVPQQRGRARARARALGIVCAAVLALTAVVGVAPAVAGTPTVPPEAAHLHPAPKVSHGPTDQPRIALTFDDNYDLPRAYRTLDVLEQMDVPATVFVIGHYQDLGPDLSQRLAADGLEIGDHTRSHADVTGLSWRALQIEIGNGTRTFTELTGRPTAPLFRPPGGFISPVAQTAATAQGFRVVVMWDIDTQDWRGASAAAITQTVLDEAHNGAIVLMHLAAPHTYEALPGVVSGLRERGYELVTVTDLLKGSNRFVDVDPATDEGTTILRMVDEGYLSGVDADYFGPFDPITPTDLAKAVGAVTGDAMAGGAEPVDSVADMLAPSLTAAPPDQAVTRLELAQTVARMARVKGYGPTGDDTAEAAEAQGDDDAEASTSAGASGSKSPAYSDVPAAATDDVGLAVDLGLMAAESGDRFGSQAPAQRRHVAVVLARVLALPAVADEAGTITDRPGAGVSGPSGAADGVRSAAALGPAAAALGIVALVAVALGLGLVALRMRAQARRRRARAARRREHAQTWQPGR